MDKKTTNDTGRWAWRSPPTLHHVSVCVISNGVDVRGDLMSFLSLVHFDDLL